MKRRICAGLSVLLCAVSLAGCGGSKQAESETGTASTADVQQSGQLAEAAPVSGETEVNYDEARAAAEKLTDKLAFEGTLELAEGNDENCIWSPVNVSMALAMLAETTDGDSRQQILDVLETASVQDMRSRMDLLWPAVSYDRSNTSEDWDGGTCLPANSIWLREGASYDQELLQILAQTYHASSYAGEMGSEAYDQMLHDWLNAQTKDLLADSVDGVSLKPETVIALVSTIYYHANWAEAFDEEATETDVFHTASGESSADYMTSRFRGDYYRGEHYGAICLEMADENCFWLLLPDEGCDVADILSDPAYLQMVKGETEGERADITLKVPKYDISSDISLSDTLQALGVTDVFEPGKADFSPLSYEDGPLYLSAAKHAARIAVDEQGVTAAAYTMMGVEAAGIEEEPELQIDFICDHPFVFAVMNRSLDLVMFEGVVNQP